jgi:PST family polysaccharide transporter
MSTRKKITSGFSWNTLTVVLQVVIQLIYTGVLARLLLPGDFALMGVVLSIMGFAEIFSQVGIGPAIIQRKEVHAQHFSGAFYTAVLLGVAFTGLFCLLAPFLGELYQMPDLIPIIRVVSTSFIISALGVVPRSLMIRELAFKKFFIAGIISIVGGNLIVGLFLAWSGFGVWAYVWALFAQNTLMTLAYWWLHPVRMPLSWKWSYTRELIRYGAGSTLFNALNYAATKVDVALTPIFSARVPDTAPDEQLRNAGLYERSAYVVSLPITIMGKLSDNVMFSGMSAMQNETERLKKSVIIAIRFLSIAIIPSVAFAACFSSELIGIYLGANYAEAVPVLQILLAGVIFRTLSRIADSLLRARDATFSGSGVKAVYLLLMVAGVVIAAPFGMEWIACAISFTTAIHFYMSMVLTRRLLGASLRGQCKAMLPGWIAAAALLAVSLPLAWLMRHLEWPGLMVLLIGASASFFTVLTLFTAAPFLLGKGEMNLVRFLPARLRNNALFRRLENP